MLNWKKPDPSPPALVARCRDMIRSAPDGIEHAITLLRELGYSKIGSMIVLMEVLELNTSQAKEIVHLSEAWTDRRASDDRFHEQLLKLVDELADESKLPPSENDSSTDQPNH